MDNLSKPGGYAEYTNANVMGVASIPEGISFAEAAAIPCASFTADHALYQRLHIESKQTILIHGGAGGVGGFALQLASLEGLEVITTCSRSNFDYVQKLGAKHLIDYQNEDVVVRVCNGEKLGAIATIDWEKSQVGVISCPDN
ncbi:MAG: hypothetical protein MGG11_17045 [Trichodesmium sp. MAG_R03]|nr:hypothetical protein [Trichodesmium sp. MAG_R03]